MFLNNNFNQKIEKSILLNSSLTDWFTKNQETMAYFELTHMGCLQFEDSSMASNDIRVLGRMANAALTWLEGEFPLTQEERASKASQSIAKIYESEKEGLSEIAQDLYSINIEDLEKAETQEVENRKVLSKHNGIKNRRPGKGHRRH